MSSKIFLDTNILIYAFDESAPAKRGVCRDILKRVQAGRIQGVISTQVMQEFAVVGMKKLGFEPGFTRDFLGALESFEIVIVQPEMIRDAIDCQVSERISFWDALIVAAAASARCAAIWSEDLNAGQTMRGVRIENPFKAGRSRSR